MSKKPLGRKAYGSIPHLPTSNSGSDKTIPEGQVRIATEEPRDEKDRILIQEKYDGSNVAVAKKDDEIIALTRAGYRAKTSPYEQHHYFSEWVKKRETYFDFLLSEGERVCGEWLLQAHGTKYDIWENEFDHRNEYGDNLLFIPFDIIDGENNRVCYNDFCNWIDNTNYNSKGTGFRFEDQTILLSPETFWGPMKAEEAYKKLLEHHEENNPPWQAQTKPEGLVYRIEREGSVDFLCKWVRPEKDDGKYLPELDSNEIEEPVWNFDPENLEGVDL